MDITCVIIIIIIIIIINFDFVKIGLEPKLQNGQYLKGGFVFYFVMGPKLLLSILEFNKFN